MGLRQRLSERRIGQTAGDMETQAARLRETMNDLEMQLLQSEELGWMRLSGSYEELEFSWQGRQRMNELAFLYWLKNPMAGRAVNTITNYVFGRGVSFRAKNERVNQVMQEFLADEDNKAELATAEAQRVKSDELQVFGNVFFALFAKDGKVKVSSILDREVQDVIFDKNNRNKPLTYKRAVLNSTYDYGSHAYTTMGSKYVYYPDWRNRDDENASPEAEGAVIRHVRVNRLGHMKFGVPELYRAMDWLRAYNKFLEDWASITAALARFAWKKKMKGGPTTIAAAAVAAQSGLASGLGLENNPAPAPGATLFENMGSDTTPIRTAGATTSPNDGRQIRLMISSATGVFDHYLSGDPSTGNLATATAMELPMLKDFEARQEIWAGVYRDILGFVIDEAGLGNLKPEEREVEVIFPNIIQKDTPALIESIVKAVTLEQGGNTNGLLPMKEATALVIDLLGVENPDKVLGDMYPEGQKPESKERDFQQKTEAMAEKMDQIIESLGGG